MRRLGLIVFMNRVLFWNVGCSVRHGARGFRTHFARSIIIKGCDGGAANNGTVIPLPMKQRDPTNSCRIRIRPIPPGLETLIRRTGIPTRRYDFSCFTYLQWRDHAGAQVALRALERVCPALPVYLTANPFSPEPPKISERGLWQYKFS